MTTTSIKTAIEDFFIFKRAQRLSATTLLDYRGILNKFCMFIGENTDVDSITSKEITHYLSSLNVSKKRVKNVYITLSSFWNWAAESGVCQEHVLRSIKPPKPEKRVVAPLEQEEVIAMLASISNGKSLEYGRPGKHSCRNTLSEVNALRDKAILLFLLDTGTRASELCNARIRDIGIIGVNVFGKGAKERVVPLSDSTRSAVGAYIATRKAKPDDYIFVTMRKSHLTRDALRQIIERIARRAGVAKAHPHKFRHTFAINFLRNGGDAFALQAILGHETLDMVKRYLAIAKTDIQRAHAKASPVMRWGL